MTEDRSDLKCYMADTGLLATFAFADNPKSKLDVMRKILTGKIEINKGMLMENAVAQMLRASGQELMPTTAMAKSRTTLAFLTKRCFI